MDAVESEIVRLCSELTARCAEAEQLRVNVAMAAVDEDAAKRRAAATKTPKDRRARFAAAEALTLARDELEIAEEEVARLTRQIHALAEHAQVRASKRARCGMAIGGSSFAGLPGLAALGARGGQA